MLGNVGASASMAGGAQPVLRGAAGVGVAGGWL